MHCLKNTKWFLEFLPQFNVLICLGLDKKDTEETESDYVVLAPDLLKIIESSVLNFHLFLKMDKKKQSNARNLFGNQNQITRPLQLIQSSLEKVMFLPFYLVY